MNINYEVLNKLLLGLTETDDISLKCKSEIQEFEKNNEKTRKTKQKHLKKLILNETEPRGERI